MSVNVKTLMLLFSIILVSSVSAEKKLFKSDKPLDITLTAPLYTIYKERDKSKTYKNANISYEKDDGEKVSIDIGLKVRGNFRLSKKNCSNPPLKFVLGKSAKGTQFSKQGELKLVLPCKNRAKYQEYIMLEYLTYKMYNLISDDSYRVRLADITFVDTDGKNKTHKFTTFFIEPHKRLAKRIKKDKYNVTKAKIHQLQADAIAKLNLFEFMIGNTDFSTLTGPEGENCCHNVKLFKAKTDKFITAIPYDFDSTGLVNPPYAAPGSTVKIREVRIRRYRGFCEQNDDVKNAVQTFNQNRAEIEALFITEFGLSKVGIKSTKKYLEKFYKIINTPKLFNSKILKYCR